MKNTSRIGLYRLSQLLQNHELMRCYTICAMVWALINIIEHNEEITYSRRWSITSASLNLVLLHLAGFHSIWATMNNLNIGYAYRISQNSPFFDSKNGATIFFYHASAFIWLFLILLDFSILIGHFVACWTTRISRSGPIPGCTLWSRTYCITAIQRSRHSSGVIVRWLSYQIGFSHAATVCRIMPISTKSGDNIYLYVELRGVALLEIWEF